MRLPPRGGRSLDRGYVPIPVVRASDCVGVAAGLAFAAALLAATAGFFAPGH